MAEYVTIARPYAKALFSLAQQKGELSACSDVLKALAAVVEQPKVSQLVCDPEFGCQKRAETLLELVGIEDKESYISNFVLVLSENHRLQELPYIQQMYDELMDEAAGVKKAVIYSAYDLSDEQVQDLLQTLGQRIEGNLQAQVKINPELIGGVKVEIGDQVLDLSIQAKLEALYQTLKS